MTTQNIDLSNVGIAGFAVDGFHSLPTFTSDTPEVTTTSEVVHSAGAITQFMVVGRDATSGNIVQANASSAKAIGVAAFSAGVGDNITLWRSGCFNPEILIWGTSYNTDLLKKTAFEATGTQIFTKAVEGPQD